MSEDNQVRYPTTYTVSSQQSTDFEMINECDLPMLTDDAEEATIVQSNTIAQSNTIQEIRESIAEAMLVDNETDESIIKSSLKVGLSTPDRPSGPLLEEMPQINVATEIDRPMEIYPINIDTQTMQLAESAMVIKTMVASTKLDSPQQSNLITEESPVSLRSINFNGLVGPTNIVSMSETCSSDHNAPIRPIIAIENPGNQPSTPERSSGPSLE